jgi:hypothetical protein
MLASASLKKDLQYFCVEFSTLSWAIFQTAAPSCPTPQHCAVLSNQSQNSGVSNASRRYPDTDRDSSCHHPELVKFGNSFIFLQVTLPVIKLTISNQDWANPRRYQDTDRDSSCHHPEFVNFGGIFHLQFRCCQQCDISAVNRCRKLNYPIPIKIGGIHAGIRTQIMTAPAIIRNFYNLVVFFTYSFGPARLMLWVNNFCFCW